MELARSFETLPPKVVFQGDPHPKTPGVADYLEGMNLDSRWLLGGVVKAFLLAGGRAERLKPLSLSCPKCLVPIDGVPLLGIWLDHCARAGITEVLLNVSHHADQVESYLERRGGLPVVRLVVEAAPHGTAGTVSLNRGFVKGEESFWVLYADNLTNVSLARMLRSHRQHNGLLTMGLFHAPVPQAAGIAELASDGRIVSFFEKPKEPRSDLANAGLYVARSKLLDELPLPFDGILDFGLHILPSLVGRMHGYVIDAFHIDIGTPTALAEASAAWALVKRSKGQVS